MEHEKIIKRENGSQVKIRINLTVNAQYFSSNRFNYRCDITTKAKGKRTWIEVTHGMHEYEYRKLSMEERLKVVELNHLNFATQEEIHEAKLELWNQLKPTI